MAQGPGSDRISYESIYRSFIGAVGPSTKPCIAGCLAKSTVAESICPMAEIVDGDTIVDRVSIHDRPAVVEPRTRLGDWEADLMSFSKPGQFLLVAQDPPRRNPVMNTDISPDTTFIPAPRITTVAAC